MTVNQFTFKSIVGFTSSATLFFGNSFESGERIRSFRIVGAKSIKNYVCVYTYDNAFIVPWIETTFCQSHPESRILIKAYAYKDGSFQIDFQRWERSIPDNCTVTIEVIDGIYNGSADGNGTIVQGQLIHREDLLISDEGYHMIATLMSKSRCLAQTTENACNAESSSDANCNWCCNQCFS
ncbi:Egg protein, partial [Schistosoma japonicum]